MAGDLVESPHAMGGTSQASDLAGNLAVATGAEPTNQGLASLDELRRRTIEELIAGKRPRRCFGLGFSTSTGCHHYSSPFSSSPLDVASAFLAVPPPALLDAVRFVGVIVARFC